jgi:hypothetical protein
MNEEDGRLNLGKPAIFLSGFFEMVRRRLNNGNDRN